MNFDADTWLKAQEHPSVTIEGVTYTGRLLSFEQFMPFGQRLEEMQKTGTGFGEFARDYLYTIYPKPKKRSWVARLRGEPEAVDPVPLIMSHPAFMEIMKSFFATQVAALGMKDDSLMMNGKNSVGGE